MINISLYDNGSGGRVETKGVNLVITRSLYTEIYIALFGGQTEKVTTSTPDTKKIEMGWFGNKPGNERRWVNSQTEAILSGMVITPTNIAKLENAIASDLKQLKKYGESTYTVSVPKPNRIDINIQMVGDNKEYQFVWDNTMKEVIISSKVKV